MDVVGSRASLNGDTHTLAQPHLLARINLAANMPRWKERKIKTASAYAITAMEFCAPKCSFFGFVESFLETVRKSRLGRLFITNKNNN